MKKKILIVVMMFAVAFSSVYAAPLMNTAHAAPAKLVYGPKYVGNMKLYITNVHNGPAGPKFPSNLTPHTNVHVDKKTLKGWKFVSNFHVVRYMNKSKTCLYIYESVKKKVVMDTCDTWSNLSVKGAKAMKSFAKVDTLTSDVTSLIAVTAVVGYYVYTLLTGKFLAVPASSEPIPDYNEALYVTEPQSVYNPSYTDPAPDFNAETVGGVEVQTTANDSIDTTELPIVNSLEYITATYNASGKDSLFVSPLVGGDNPSVLTLQNQFSPRFTIQNSSGTIVKSGTLNGWIRSEEYYNKTFMYRSSTNISTAGLTPGHYRVKILMNVDGISYTSEEYPVLTNHFYVNADRTLNQFSQ